MVALLLALVCQDELYDMGEKALANARDNFEKSKWFDCIEQAEKARNAFQALADLYDSQKRTGDRQRAEEQVKICNQLIKLANDKRKAEAAKNEPPPPPPPPPKIDPPKDEPPAPPPPPPPTQKKESEADSAVPPAAAADFGKFLAGEFDVKNADKMAPLLKGLSTLAQTAGHWQGFGRVAWTIVTECIDGAWTVSPDDRAVYKEYAEKFLTPPAKCHERGAALFLAKAAESVDPLARWRMLRMLALAHAQASLKEADSPLKLELPSKGKALDITQNGDAWVTREGDSILAFQDEYPKKDANPVAVWKKAGKVRDPVRDAYRALSLFDAFVHGDAKTAGEIASEGKSFFAPSDSASASLLAAVKALLDGRKPCKSCDGTHLKRCPGGCDEKGQKLFTCPKCGGDANLSNGKKKVNCREPPPDGKKWDKGKHTCMIDCVRCEGKGFIPCRDCSAAWSGAALLDGIKVDPCGLCGGSGWLLEDVKLPCAVCFGTGKRYNGLVKK